MEPRCTHFGPPDSCGGCSWQHLTYREQLQRKTELVRTLVEAEVPGRGLKVADILPATSVENPWEYRHKVHFVFANAGRRGPLLMGHYVRGSRAVFAARECPVHVARGNAFAFAFHEECVRAGVLAAPQGTLRHIAIRVAAATGETMATVVVTDASDKALRTATKRALARPEAPHSLHLNIHRRDDPYIFGSETRRIHGPRHLREQVAGATFLVSPTAFFQTNVSAAEILVRLVLEALPPGRPVVDLYAGVGLFAIPLAKRGDTVVAVEENQAAAKDGIASLTLNGVPRARCRFVARAVEAAVGAVTPAHARHLVLDPPREGCAPVVIDHIFGRLRPERVVYVSCNPEALAGDLGRIVGGGYEILALQPVDMFPHTAHVETVAVLKRAITR